MLSKVNSHSQQPCCFVKDKSSLLGAALALIAVIGATMLALGLSKKFNTPIVNKAHIIAGGSILGLGVMGLVTFSILKKCGLTSSKQCSSSNTDLPDPSQDSAEESKTLKPSKPLTSSQDSAEESKPSSFFKSLFKSPHPKQSKEEFATFCERELDEWAQEETEFGTKDKQINKAKQAIQLNLKNQLLSLNISNCRIQSIPFDLISHNRKIKQLVISSTNLSLLPKNLDTLFPNLESLNLSNNQISSIERVSFPNKLKRLHLGDNQISTYKNSNFPVSLEHLNLSKNRITIFYSLSYLNNLTALLIANNEISCFTNPQHNLFFPISLKSLDLSFNSIKELPDCFEDLANLKDINLNSNHLTSLPQSLKNKLKNARQLSYNFLDNPQKNLKEA